MEKFPLKPNNFKARFYTTVTLGPIISMMILAGNPYTFFLFIVITFAALYEWILIARSHKIWLFGGIVYITLAMFSLGLFVFKNLLFLLILVLISWISDISAYLVGSKLKGPKLAPKISPGKTWSGSIGGFVFGIPFTMLMFSYVFSHDIISSSQNFSFQYHLKITLEYLGLHLSSMFILSGFLIMVAQGGDLLESWAKRCFNIKDSGNILPGHGGILDRIDSLLAVGFVLFFYVVYQYNNIIFELFNNK